MVPYKGYCLHCVLYIAVYFCILDNLFISLPSNLHSSIFDSSSDLCENGRYCQLSDNLLKLYHRPQIMLVIVHLSLNQYGFIALDGKAVYLLIVSVLTVLILWYLELCYPGNKVPQFRVSLTHSFDLTHNVPSHSDSTT